MKISTKGRYALIIMVYLAKHYDENRYISLKEISYNEGISVKYLEKIMRWAGWCFGRSCNIF